MTITHTSLESASKNTKNPYLSYKNDILLFNDSVLDKRLLKPQTLDLIITSPPYNVGIEYNSNEDSNDYKDYLKFTEQYLKNCYLWAKDTARFCLNIPLDKNKGGSQSVGLIYKSS